MVLRQAEKNGGKRSRRRCKWSHILLGNRQDGWRRDAVQSGRVGLLCGGQVRLAVFTACRADGVYLVYMLGHHGLMGGMSELAAALAPLATFGLGRARAG